MADDKERQQDHAMGRVYSIAPGRHFLDCLADAILSGDLPRAGAGAPGPLDLPAYTLLLPTRRACRAMQEAFLRRANTKALMLPTIRPIADGDDDRDLIASLTGTGDHHDAIELPPAVTELERRLVLTELVMKWSEVIAKSGTLKDARAAIHTPSQAAFLASELGQLMDAVETEEVDLIGLHELVPEEHSVHWQRTLDFLKIVTEYWPAHLQERGLLSPMERRNQILHREAARLMSEMPDTPYIVAGVTGSVPATARFMKAVAGLERGALVLPGLDKELDDLSWHAIGEAHPEHPQCGLKRLLGDLGVTRDEIEYVKGGEPSAPHDTRSGFISEAMRPASTTHAWHEFSQNADPDDYRSALEKVQLLEAASPEEEAEAIALIMRSALEVKGRSVALVTPDRILARRLTIRLEEWGIRVDDSAGRPFVKTVSGTFLDLILDAVANRFSSVSVMALLKHPLTRLGLDVAHIRRAGRALELIAFRNTYLGEGLEAIDAAMTRREQNRTTDIHTHQAVKRLTDEDWLMARDLINRLKNAFEPFMTTLKTGGQQLRLCDMARAHIEVAEMLARNSDENYDALWDGESGEAAALLFTGFLDETIRQPEIKPSHYADFYRSLVSGHAVRPRIPVHPNVSIWGPYEARLQQSDIMILGGLNDGIWPQAAEPDPWLNRPMRAELGLPAPEEMIGFAAHDFTQLLGAQTIYMTRATKNDGVPTVPSRWLLRINALLQGLGIEDALAGDASQPWLAFARNRDHAANLEHISAPAPTPPVKARPRRMSVTGIENWIRNPYWVYARNILKLAPLDGLRTEPDARLRGTIIHWALHRFVERHPKELPENIVKELMQIADELIEEYSTHPRVAVFWRPRLVRFAEWFAETEPFRRRGIEEVLVEVAGELSFESAGGTFKLNARADRIDQMTDGSLRIFDYKTGTPPNAKAVEYGRAPQLPLEGAIAEAGGFDGIDPGPVRDLSYIRADGGLPPGEEKDVSKGKAEERILNAMGGLRALVERFDQPGTAYSALRRAGFQYDYDDYAHLARVEEWSRGGSDDE